MIDTESLKAQVDIASVLEWLEIDWPQHKRHPKIRCPLPDHTERTPSCVIYPETNSWHCFGCTRGGDIIDLVQKVMIVHFADAVKWIEERANITVGQVIGERERTPEQLVEPVAFQAHGDVVRWMHQHEPTVAQRDTIFAFYDETIRAWDAHEITAQQTIQRLIDWRLQWKARLA